MNQNILQKAILQKAFFLQNAINRGVNQNILQKATNRGVNQNILQKANFFTKHYKSRGILQKANFFYKML